MKEHDIDKAMEAGRIARRGNTPFALCPHRFNRTTEGHLLADAWRSGWNEQDTELRSRGSITPSGR